jgi:hypothetical protein
VKAPFKPLWQSALPFAAVVVVGAFAACNNGEISIGTDQPATCASNTDCPMGDMCGAAHVCGIGCVVSGDCPPNELCEGGVCTKGGGSSSSSSSGKSSSSSGSTQVLDWYYTCGDPVCHGHTPHTGVPACTTEKAGTPCTTSGQECDPGDTCNSLLECASTDPTHGPGGCPISRARFKHDIRYLPDGELTRVKDDLMTMRLTTWRYNHEGETGREHLGFIIDDNPESPSVDASGDHVDLYGYTSMAVAALQVQDKQIAAQRQQIAELQKAVDALRTEVRACGAGSR